MRTSRSRKMRTERRNKKQISAVHVIGKTLTATWCWRCGCQRHTCPPVCPGYLSLLDRSFSPSIVCHCTIFIILFGHYPHIITEQKLSRHQRLRGIVQRFLQRPNFGDVIMPSPACRKWFSNRLYDLDLLTLPPLLNYCYRVSS